MSPANTISPYGPTVRIRGFHPRGQGSIPCKDFALGERNTNTPSRTSCRLRSSVVEQVVFAHRVAGSSPVGVSGQVRIISLSVAQLAEHSAVVRGVRGSNPRGEIPVSRAGSEIRAGSLLLRRMGPFFNRSHTAIFLYLDLKSTGICLRRFESCRRGSLGVSKWSKEVNTNTM